MATKKILNYRDRIKSKFMNQNKLAQLTGIHPVRISVVLNNKEEFTDKEIKDCFKALNIK